MACESVRESDTQRSMIPDILIEATDITLKKKAAVLYKADSLFSGYILAYHSNKTLASKAGYLNGELQGEAIKYYENGQLQERRFYHDNRKTGHHEGFWSNGVRKFEYFFEKGIHEGTLKEWYKTGEPFRFFNYEAGKESGAQRMWESDGTVRANYVVKDGHRYGLIGLKNCKSVTNEEGLYTAIAY